jgi:carbon storage regulator
MLVLSRRLHEKVLFPGFNTAIEVLSMKAGKVRLGIEAPAEVTVLREELHDQSGAAPMASFPAAEPSKIRKIQHLLRNRLDVAEIGLTVLARQLEAGLLQDGQTTLAKVREDLELLRQRLQRELSSAESTLGEAVSLRLPFFGTCVEKHEMARRSLAEPLQDACCGV